MLEPCCVSLHSSPLCTEVVRRQKTRFIDGSSYLETDCITCFKSFLSQSGSSSSPLLSSSMLDFVIPGFFYEQGIIEFIILQLPLPGSLFEESS